MMHDERVTGNRWAHGLTFHGDGLRESHAAVNVKCRHSLRAIELDAQEAAKDMGSVGAAERIAWWAALDDETRQTWWDCACQDGWERLTERARELWGPSATVYSEGRSGGWAVPEPNGRGGFTREDVEEWRREDRRKWDRFESTCAAVVAEIPYQAAMLAFITNAWEVEQEKRETARRVTMAVDVEEAGLADRF